MVLPLPVMKTAEKRSPLSAASRSFSCRSSGSLRKDAHGRDLNPSGIQTPAPRQACSQKVHGLSSVNALCGFSRSDSVMHGCPGKHSQLLRIAVADDDSAADGVHMP